MTAALEFVDVFGGIASIFLLVRAGNDVIATEARPAGTRHASVRLARSKRIGADLTRPASIGAHRIMKRI